MLPATPLATLALGLLILTASHAWQIKPSTQECAHALLVSLSNRLHNFASPAVTSSLVVRYAISRPLHVQSVTQPALLLIPPTVTARLVTANTNMPHPPYRAFACLNTFAQLLPFVRDAM